MNFFRQIMQKPWTAASAAPDNLFSGQEFSVSTAKVGLRVFLGVVTVVFSLLTVMYFGRMAYSDWRPLPDPWLLWLNTGLLISSSVAFHHALVAVRRNQLAGVKDGLLFGGIFAACFLLGQILVWRQLVELGFYADTNPANAFFYVVTGLHGVHLLGGLVAWGRTSVKLLTGTEPDGLRLSIELCDTYWNYLLIVWFVLFGLLLFT